jgi:hypothetical protein
LALFCVEYATCGASNALADYQKLNCNVWLLIVEALSCDVEVVKRLFSPSSEMQGCERRRKAGVFQLSIVPQLFQNPRTFPLDLFRQIAARHPVMMKNHWLCRVRHPTRNDSASHNYPGSLVLPLFTQARLQSKAI